MGIRWNLRVVLICIFLRMKEINHFFKCFLDIQDMTVYLCTPFFPWVIGCCLISWVPYIYMDILPLSDVELVKIFFLLWIFSVSWGPTYEMLIVVPGILFRKLPRLPMFPKLLSLSSIRYSVSNFMLMSLIHLDLSYVQANKHGSIWIVLYADIQLDHDTCWMCSPLFHCMVLASSSKRKCQ